MVCCSVLRCVAVCCSVLHQSEIDGVVIEDCDDGNDVDTDIDGDG